MNGETQLPAMIKRLKIVKCQYSKNYLTNNF